MLGGGHPTSVHEIKEGESTEGKDQLHPNGFKGSIPTRRRRRWDLNSKTEQKVKFKPQLLESQQDLARQGATE